MQRGDRVGPYGISGHIGTGGMGEVYRARDTRLQRDVAVKIVPDLFARDPERLSRFTREAQSLAALNHPNVAHVYGVDEPSAGSGQVRALIMEFVDGEDLAQRLTRGAMPPDEAVAIALQIACGLEAAHERGIVHRDLKPANVRVTPDGTAKILDFGLAKAGEATEEVEAARDPLNSPTFTRLRQGSGEAGTATELGVILGTAAYMAPEQARGRPVDKRADIWAFGCVVYEMLTAKRPFGGESVTDALAAILKEEPDWASLPAETPGRLRELLRRCLVKDPKQRLRDIGDARIALEAIRANPAGDAVAPPPGSTDARRSSSMVTAAGMVGILIGAIVASIATWLSMRQADPQSPQLARFVTPLPLEALPLRVGGSGVAFSPDGSSIVYAAQPALTAQSSLFRRRIDGLDVERIPNTQGATAPFFSPDGRWIGFITEAAVMKVSADGQSLVKICDRTRFSRATWGPEDTIFLGTAQSNANGPLAKVPAGGGTPVDVTSLTGNETVHQLPQVSPDGRHLIFSVISPAKSELAIVPIGGGAHRLLGMDGTGAMFVAPAHLLFARGRTMFTVPFDASRNEIRGNPQQVLEDAAVVSGAGNVWIPLAAADRHGSIAYLNKGGSVVTMRWLAAGSAPLPVPEADYRTPRLSPDGGRLVAAAGAAPSEVWVIDLDRGTRLLVAAAGGTAPVWSHDGQRIIYAAASGALTSVQADGSATPEVLLARLPGFNVVPTAVSPDGAFMVVNAENRAASTTRNRDIWIVRRGQKPEPFIASPADERGGVMSPDGRWIAYSSSVSGREEIYVKSVTGTGRTIPISTQGGTSPRWPRMDALYFLGPRTLMRAPITAEPFAAGAAVETAELPPNMVGFDVHRDGRILITEPKVAGTGIRDALHVLLNWGPTLK